MRRIRNVTTLIAATVMTHAATAGSSQWQCHDGGSFDLVECWDNEIVPGDGDTAVFDFGGLYTMVLPDHVRNSRLLVRSGFVTFDLTGFGNYILDSVDPTQPSLVVGENGPVNAVLTASVGPSSFSANNVVLGQHPLSTGMLEVLLDPDAPFESFTINGSIEIGAAGTGMLAGEAGDAPLFFLGNNAWTIGRDPGSAGFVTLTGNVTANALVGLDIGKGGFAEMHLEGGARFQTAGVAIGEQAAALGALTVRDPGSALDCDGLSIGMLGHAFVTVESGSLVETLAGVVIGGGQNGTTIGTGELAVTGTGSRVDIGGSLLLGLGGSATLVLAAGGVVDIEGDVLRGDAAANEVIFELASADDYPLAALAAGGMIDDLDARVHLVEGFTPAAGDRFALAAADLSLGVVSFLELPPLPEPLFWIVLEDTQSVAIRVGPVPGDVNDDGVVDVNDLVIVIANWGPCPTPPEPCPGDADGNGEVDVADLVLVVENWE